MKLYGQGDAQGHGQGGENNEDVSYFASHDFHSFASGWQSLIELLAARLRRTAGERLTYLRRAPLPGCACLMSATDFHSLFSCIHCGHSRRPRAECRVVQCSRVAVIEGSGPPSCVDRQLAQLTGVDLPSGAVYVARERMFRESEHVEWEEHIHLLSVNVN